MHNDAIVNAMLTPRETSESVNSTQGIDPAAVRNIVLDIGNVIVRWDPDALLATAFDNKAQQRQALADTIGHGDWIEMDRGKLSLDEAASRAQKRSHLPADAIRRIYDNLGPSLTALDDTMAAMHEVAASGIPLYILSNMQHHAWAWLRENHDCWRACRGIVVSCDTGHVKPESEIYQHLTQRFELNPAHCVFIDDVAINVEAARQAGWQSVQLTDRAMGGSIIRQLAAMIESG